MGALCVVSRIPASVTIQAHLIRVVRYPEKRSVLLRMWIVASNAGESVFCSPPYAGHRTQCGRSCAGTWIYVGAIPSMGYLEQVGYVGCVQAEGIGRITWRKGLGARPRFTTPVTVHTDIVITGAPQCFVWRMTGAAGELVGLRQGNGLRPVKRRQE